MIFDPFVWSCYIRPRTILVRHPSPGSSVNLSFSFGDLKSLIHLSCSVLFCIGVDRKLPLHAFPIHLAKNLELAPAFPPCLTFVPFVISTIPSTACSHPPRQKSGIGPLSGNLTIAVTSSIKEIFFPPASSFCTGERLALPFHAFTHSFGPSPQR